MIKHSKKSLHFYDKNRAEKARIIRCIVNENKKDSLVLFRKLAQSGIVWLEILNTLVLEPASTIKEQQINNQTMASLIEARDILDYMLYEAAAHNIFPRDKWTIVHQPRYIPRKDEEHGFKLKYYDLKIYDNANEPTNFQTIDKPYIRITIKASGSRTFTSDIDTTISVENAEKFSNCLPDEVLTPFAKNEVIKNRMICFFHILNDQSLGLRIRGKQEKYGITSALSRDSNIYSNGYLGTYPKFNKLIIDKIDVIQTIADLDSSVLPKYHEYKASKQTYELAASFAPLYDVLADTFGVDTNKTAGQEFMKSIYNELKNASGLNESIQEMIRINLKKAVSTMLKLLEKRDELLDLTKKQLRKKRQTSPLGEKKFELDLHIATMNTLYVRILNRLCGYKVGQENIEKNIAKLWSEVRKKFEVIAFQKQKKEVERKTLQNYEQEGNITSTQMCKKNLEKLHEELIALNEDLKKKKSNLTGYLKKHAECLRQQQLIQLKANLFAYEAYINRSAPYHVVKGMQSGGEIQLSKQVVMGSVLQQIGFKLLHAQELRKQGKTEGEIAYKTAKYSQRVADVILGECKYVENKYASSFNILKYLRRGASYNRLFTTKEIGFLESEINIVKIKREKKIPDYKKFTEAAKHVESRRLNIKEEQEILLSIARKVIVATYKARLDHKHESGLDYKYALWGQNTQFLQKNRSTDIPTSAVKEKNKNMSRRRRQSGSGLTPGIDLINSSDTVIAFRGINAGIRSKEGRNVIVNPNIEFGVSKHPQNSHTTRNISQQLFGSVEEMRRQVYEEVHSFTGNYQEYSIWYMNTKFGCNKALAYAYLLFRKKEDH